VLNGIGGRTIEEAKERITHAEFVSWYAYIKKRGTLNVGLRLEMGFAMLAQVTNNSMGGKSKFEDFMPKREEEPEKAASIGEVFSLLKSKSKMAN
jgi:hypothetical protein